MMFCGAAFAMLAVVMLGGCLPEAVIMLYAVTSAATFVVYGMDKSLAERGSRRIGEKSLHGLSLIGGWPGACLAQQMFRHKTGKASFQLVFRLMVALNCAAAGWLFVWPAVELH
ncbi:hypothetical protein GALL_283580 [mine drainage metagenome]|uniref:Membrane protein containing DUF1294 n=1 Tax=mine drainage metagenome TaxID=410659 RepID=A0A1J5R1A9_9ZZZZ